MKIPPSSSPSVAAHRPRRRKLRRFVGVSILVATLVAGTLIAVADVTKSQADIAATRLAVAPATVVTGEPGPAMPAQARQEAPAQDSRLPNARAARAPPVAAVAAPIGSPQPADRRRIATAALGAVGAPDAPEADPRGDFVIDVPVYVHNAGDLRAVDVQCTVFGQGYGDTIGTGHVERAIANDTFSQTVSVPIQLRSGRRPARAARYSCRAVFMARGPSSDRVTPTAGGGGAAGASDRRQVHERQVGRPLITFVDQVDGEIARR